MDLDYITNLQDIMNNLKSVSEANSTCFCVFGYEYTGTFYTLIALNKGAIYKDMLEALKSDQFLYIFAKIPIIGSPYDCRTFFIQWIGTDVSESFQRACPKHASVLRSLVTNKPDCFIATSNLNYLMLQIDSCLQNTKHVIKETSISPVMTLGAKRAASFSYGPNKSTEFKIIICGRSDVGKTLMLEHFFYGGKPMLMPAPTGGPDFKIKLVSANGYQFKLQIWDTVGQERFISLSPNWFRNANAIILAYDITDFKSYEAVEFWRKESINNGVFENAIFVLVGNKLDISTKRTVEYEEGRKYAYRNDFKIFYEISSFTGQNLFAMFDALICELAIVYQSQLEESKLQDSRLSYEHYILKSSERNHNSNVEECSC